MKIVYLLPPSEGKNSGGEFNEEKLTFLLDKPSDIVNNVTEKDLKCIGKRFEEGVRLNAELVGTFSYPTCLEVTKRYSGVMYNSIDYSGMNIVGKEFFEDNFLILSGMYGLVKPLDIIGNYKLPIETKGLYKYWGTKIIESINDLRPDYVINLLPISYSKLLFGNTKQLNKEFNLVRNFGIININFLKEDGKKVSHGVKKIKGEWIKNICENSINNYKEFGGNIVVKKEGIIDVDIMNK